MNKYARSIIKQQNQLANASCMYDSNTTIPEKFEELLVKATNMRANTDYLKELKEQICWKILAIQANCSKELYNKLNKIVKKHEKKIP